MKRKDLVVGMHVRVGVSRKYGIKGEGYIMAVEPWHKERWGPRDPRPDESKGARGVALAVPARGYSQPFASPPRWIPTVEDIMSISPWDEAIAAEQTAQDALDRARLKRQQAEKAWGLRMSQLLERLVEVLGEDHHILYSKRIEKKVELYVDDVERLVDLARKASE